MIIKECGPCGNFTHALAAHATENIIKGGDGFVLLESPYGFILLWDRLGKRALQVEGVAKSHQSADINFVFQFSLCFREKPPCVNCLGAE